MRMTICKYPQIIFSTSISIVFFAFLLSASLSVANPSLEPREKVVVDKTSGLMWQRQDSFFEIKEGMNWYDAQAYLDQKNAEKFAGYSDWRLPAMKELKELWDSSRPLKNQTGEKIGLPEEFAGGGSYYLWTNDERGLDNAWYFGLGHKEEYFNLKDLGDLNQGVLMVRSIKESGG